MNYDAEGAKATYYKEKLGFEVDTEKGKQQRQQLQYKYLEGL